MKCAIVVCSCDLWCLLQRLHTHSVCLVSFYRLNSNIRVIYNPAMDNPYHVMAYPTWIDGLTLNSPTLSAVGDTGHFEVMVLVGDDVTVLLSSLLSSP